MPNTQVGPVFSVLAKTQIVDIPFPSVLTVFPLGRRPDAPVGTVFSTQCFRLGGEWGWGGDNNVLCFTFFHCLRIYLLLRGHVGVVMDAGCCMVLHDACMLLDATCRVLPAGCYTWSCLHARQLRSPTPEALNHPSLSLALLTNGSREFPACMR